MYKSEVLQFGEKIYMTTRRSKMKKKILAFILTVVMVLALVPATSAADEGDEDGDTTGDVQLIIDGTLYNTYDTIQDAVDYLKTLVSYEVTNQSEYATGSYAYTGATITYGYTSAEISFTGTHTENVDVTKSFTDPKWKVTTGSSCTYAVPMSNITFNGNGTGVLNGKFTINGDNITIKNIHFIGNYNQKFSYYSTDCAIVIKGDAGLSNANRIVSQSTIDAGSAYVSQAGNYRNTILTNNNITVSGNEFEGYSFISNFGVSGGTVSGFNMDNNYVHDCMFVFHTSDADAVTLSVTNNTFEGTAESTLATCVAATTLTAFSGNTLIYAGFGLQNCDTDISQFLNRNTYYHGYIYQETVDYTWTNDSLTDSYYYLPSSTTVYTVLPDGVYKAVWTSDYNEAGSMVEGLTYTQQDAIDDAVEVAEADPDTASCWTITWTGGGTDENGKVLAGGVAIGYNYTAVHLGYAKVTEPGMDKTILVEEEVVVTDEETGEETIETVTVEKEQDDVAADDTVDYKLTSTIPDALADHIEYESVEETNEETGETTIKAVGHVIYTTDDDGNPVYDTYTLVFHDELAEGLTFDSTSLKVYIDDKELGSSYYTVTSTGLSDSCTFEVSIELLALYTADLIDESDFGKTEIYVTYSATVDGDIEAGEYKNTAWVTYDGTDSEEDVVVVDTYGIKVFKYDQENEKIGLAGAEFTVYSDENCTTVVGTIKTDSAGYGTLEGLDLGTYYLVETSAPDGYVCSDTPLKVVIAHATTGEDGEEVAQTYDAKTNLVSVSFANAKIPETGGAGTVIFTVVGAGIIAVAGVVLVVSRRKHEDEE